MTSETTNDAKFSPLKSDAAMAPASDDLPGFYVLAIYHGDTGNSVLAYYTEANAMKAYDNICGMMANDDKGAEIADDIGTKLFIRGNDVRAVRLVTQGGQRKLQVAGNVENVRVQQATSKAMREAFGQDPTATALVDTLGRPVKPRRQ